MLHDTCHLGNAWLEYTIQAQSLTGSCEECLSIALRLVLAQLEVARRFGATFAQAGIEGKCSASQMAHLTSTRTGFCFVSSVFKEQSCRLQKSAEGLKEKSISGLTLSTPEPLPQKSPVRSFKGYNYSSRLIGNSQPIKFRGFFGEAFGAELDRRPGRNWLGAGGAFR